MKIQVVADDSGTKGTGTHLVFGGLMGRNTDWANFTDAWQECLSRHPRVDYFKLAEAAKRSGAFTGFNELQRDEKLRALARVVSRFHLVAITVTVVLADHSPSAGSDLSSLAAPRHRARARYINNSFEHPYYSARMLFFFAAIKALWEGGIREPFDLIVDHHPSLGSRNAELFGVQRAIVPDDMRSIAPTAPVERDDKIFLPLQAADMIAGLRRMEAEGRSELQWLVDELAALRRSPHSVHADAAFWKRMEAAHTSYGNPNTYDNALDELLALYPENPFKQP